MSELKIPESWAEVDLEHLVYLRARIGWKGLKASEYTTEGPLFLSVREINDDGTLTLTKVNHISHERFEESPEIMLKDGDVIISKDGTIGKVAYVENLQEMATVNSSMAVLTPHDGFRYKFLFHYLKAPSFQSLVKQKIQGAAIPHIFQKDLRKLIVPIPPEKEQERIVQKIETCFSKIEETEQNLNKVEILLEKYRESLLAKAFRGELIPQNPDDEPASVLLSKIKKKNNSSQSDEFYRLKEEDIPYELPADWVWCTLPEVGILSRGKSKHRPRNDKKLFGGKYPFIQTGDIANADMYVREHETTYNEFGLSQSRLYPEGTLCITIAANIGKTAILTYPACFPDSIVGFTPHKGCLTSEFVLFFFEFIQTNLEKIAPGAAQKNINLEILSKIPFPLPPLNVQKEIKKRINNSFLYLSQEKILTQSQRLVLNHLRNSILAKAFEGRLVEQIDSEGTGHELLQKILEQKNQTVSAKESTKKKVAKKVSKKKTTKK
jgi:type I restriction enzyme, S subunit